MFQYLYEYITTWWWNTPETAVKERQSNIGNFMKFLKQEYPDLTEERLRSLKMKYYKIHRQMVVNKIFRGRNLNKRFLAAKLTKDCLVKLNLPKEELDRNQKLWEELQNYT